MPAKKYLVTLNEEEGRTLRELIKKGTLAARKLSRAHILLLADEGRTDDEIAAALHVGRATVERVRKRFVEDGFEEALRERPPSRESTALGCQAGGIYHRDGLLYASRRSRPLACAPACR